jgi:hypothetical protein
MAYSHWHEYLPHKAHTHAYTRSYVMIIILLNKHIIHISPCCKEVSGTKFVIEHVIQSYRFHLAA